MMNNRGPFLFLKLDIQMIVKIAERTGCTLKDQLSSGSLWGGVPCGREDCTTCTQGGEFIPDCTRASVVYENVCQTCNPDAGKKGELEKVRTDVPSLYVGESSRSIYERSKEHWGDWRSRSSRSHIKKHQEQAHEGNEEPNFQMRVIGSSKTALSRQIKEAVRIRRRGGEGSILNSKSEYSRCKIPRLIIEEEDEEELDKLEDEELARKREQLEHELSTWSNMKFYARERECREKRRRLEKIERKITARK